MSVSTKKWKEIMQQKNVQKDETLKRGCIKLGAGILDEENETITIRKGLRLENITLFCKVRS